MLPERGVWMCGKIPYVRIEFTLEKMFCVRALNRNLVQSQSNIQYMNNWNRNCTIDWNRVCVWHLPYTRLTVTKLLIPIRLIAEHSQCCEEERKKIIVNNNLFCVDVFFFSISFSVLFHLQRKCDLNWKQANKKEKKKWATAVPASE